jgi:hypothetical protein
MARPFKGTINLDLRDSKPDWDAFLDARAPAEARNVAPIASPASEEHCVGDTVTTEGS